jgi:hypothetical protein
MYMQEKGFFTTHALILFILPLTLFFSFALVSAAPWDEGWQFRQRDNP